MMVVGMIVKKPREETDNTNQNRQLREEGFVVLRDVFSSEEIEWARQAVLTNTSLMKRTRPAPSSLHLAGFHRYPEFEKLHGSLSCNARVLSFLRQFLGGHRVRTIGLSDITINRSQTWHKDLLRGKYSQHIDPDLIWSNHGAALFRVLMYLQDSASLKIVPGSHLEPIALDNDESAIPHDPARVKCVSVTAGDVVIMDVRMSHRGSEEDVFLSEGRLKNLRILVATTLGDAKHVFTDRMEEGNAARLSDWMQRNR